MKWGLGGLDPIPSRSGRWNEVCIGCLLKPFANHNKKTTCKFCAWGQCIKRGLFFVPCAHQLDHENSCPRWKPLVVKALLNPRYSSLLNKCPVLWLLGYRTFSKAWKTRIFIQYLNPRIIPWKLLRENLACTYILLTHGIRFKILSSCQHLMFHVKKSDLRFSLE